MDENVFLLHSFLLGVGITFLYDILRILRRVFAHSTSMVSLEDLAFWIYCAGKVFLLMFHESNGNLRWFAVLGALAGMYLYHRTISPFFVKYVALGLNTLLHPIRKALRITGNWLKKQLTILRKMLKIFIKRRCAYGKKKSSLPQETPEPVQYVPGDPGRVDDHGGRCGAERGITTKIAGYDTQIASLGAQIEAEQTRAEQIEEFGKYTQTKAYVEEVAKDKLGLVYEGEILFQEDN